MRHYHYEHAKTRCVYKNDNKVLIMLISVQIKVDDKDKRNNISQYNVHKIHDKAWRIVDTDS